MSATSDLKYIINYPAYLGNIPVRSPILPVHQSAALSVLFVIVMISPFLNPKSPGWSASNVNRAIAWSLPMDEALGLGVNFGFGAVGLLGFGELLYE